MQHVNASARAIVDPAGSDPIGAGLLAAYRERLAATGRGNIGYEQGARAFLRRWPNPHDWARQSLADRLAASSATRPFITYLMVHQGLTPGYDYLLERKLSSIWREINGSWLGTEIDRFLQVSEQLGFTMRVRLGTGSQVPVLGVLLFDDCAVGLVDDASFRIFAVMRFALWPSAASG